MTKRSRYHDAAVTIRSATWADVERVELLAELDSAEVPPAPRVLAFVGDELWVTVSVASGAVIADPFRPSAAVAALASERARQLATVKRGRGRLRWVPGHGFKSWGRRPVRPVPS